MITLFHKQMDYDYLLKAICLALLVIYTLFFIYCIYTLRNLYNKFGQNTNLKEEIPCPSTCNAGYECTQTEVPAEFVIGEVVQENVFEGIESAAEPAKEILEEASELHIEGEAVSDSNSSATPAPTTP